MCHQFHHLRSFAVSPCCRHVHAAVQIKSIDIGGGTRACMQIDCGVKEGLWLCTFCGEIYCGRYVKQHMLQHQEKKPKHCVCLDITGLAAFCYACDDFIMNDTTDKKLDQLRNLLSDKKVEEEHEPELKMPKKAKKAPKRRSRKTASRSSQKRKRSTSSEESGKRTKPEADQTKFKGVGLRNLGNTCYMNAVLQSLSNIQEFRCYFEQLPSLEELMKSRSSRKKRKNSDNPLEAIEDKGLMVEELRRILTALAEGNGKTPISPESLYNVIFKFVPTLRSYRYQQQDAHEFLICILDRLHSELREYSFDSYPRRAGSPSSSSSSSSNSSSGSVKPSCSNNYWSFCLGYVDFGAYNSIVKTYPGPKGTSSMVTSIFGGTLQSEISCLRCKHESKNHEAFLDLSLDIPSDYYPDRRGRTRIATPDGPVCDISDCLLSFTRREELDENEFYNCPGCKGRQPIAKKFLIRKLPNVLILHLKRFHWIGTAHAKIDALVKFPVRDLDMSDYVMPNLPETRGSKLGSNLYDLAAVVVHHGMWAGSGHYTTFALNEGNWYHFNDTTVKPTDEETVSSSKAYILFYIRREFRDS